MTIAIHCKTLSFAAFMLTAFPLLCQASPMGEGGPMGNAGIMGQPRLQADPDCVTVTNRPLSDFLSAQGTLNDPPAFFPPVKDYVGWVDGGVEVFALVDYAGLANASIKSATGVSLGTNVVGYVKECGLADGKTLVTVGIFTTRALGFAQTVEALDQNGFDFGGTPAFFGVKAADVRRPGAAAAGPASLTATFAIEEPGGLLPDMVDVLYNNPAGYAPLSFSFTSSTFGDCTGDARRGRKARLDVHQAGATDDAGIMVYTAEKVEVTEADGGNCRD